MNKLSILTILVSLVLFTGCTSTPVHDVVCTAETQVVNAVSAGVATGLQCANSAQVTADITAIVAKVGICAPVTPATTHKKINPFLCGLIGDLAVNQVGKVLPATWQCTPTAASATLKGLIVAACQAIPGL